MLAADRLGFLPMVLVASGIAAANAYGFMPVVRHSGDEVLSIWLQVSDAFHNVSMGVGNSLQQ